MNTRSFLIVAALTAAQLIFFSCQKDEIEAIDKTDISGVVQKGPFNVGTSVTLSELNEDYSQTGKTYITQINSDDGLFEIKGLELASPYVEVKADGFYFDEISGENSLAKLSLSAIADVSDKNSINVNVLTYLEKPRVEYLLANGYSFTEAKAQAKPEVLNVFKLLDSANADSETLDITKQGDENAALLTLSAIMQGYRSVADVSELLTNVATDLKEDGTLDDTILQTSLISHAVYIDPVQVRQNMSNKYTALGETVQIPEFSHYLDQFVNSSEYTPVSIIGYPEQSSKGSNILNTNNSVFDAGANTSYSMAVNPVKGISTKIELKVTGGITEDFKGAWGYRMDTENWSATVFDRENNVQTFTVIDSEKPADLQILFFSPGIEIQIKYIEGRRESIREISIK